MAELAPCPAQHSTAQGSEEHRTSRCCLQPWHLCHQKATNSWLRVQVTGDHITENLHVLSLLLDGSSSLVPQESVQKIGGAEIPFYGCQLCCLQQHERMLEMFGNDFLAFFAFNSLPSHQDTEIIFYLGNKSHLKLILKYNVLGRSCEPFQVLCSLFYL